MPFESNFIMKSYLHDSPTYNSYVHDIFLFVRTLPD